LSCALVAAAPSPENPRTPVPATVEITPATEIRRTRLPAASATNTLPFISAAMPSA
jgi:hypothetical protein